MTNISFKSFNKTSILNTLSFKKTLISFNKTFNFNKFSYKRFSDDRMDNIKFEIDDDEHEKIIVDEEIEKIMKNHKMNIHMKNKEMFNRMNEQKVERTNKFLASKRAFLHKLKILEVDENSPKLNVVGIDNGYFSINDVWIPGAVLLFPKRYYMWGVTDAHDIKPHTLDLFKVVKPKPSFLIVGTGKYNVEFPQSFYDHFEQYKIRVETMPTFEAIAHFNSCNEDDISIAAALIPNNL